MSGNDGSARSNRGQLPLHFDVSVSQSRDDLIEAPSIEAAVTAIDQWPDWPSHILILAGPTGSGKSHLAHIWQLKSNAVEVDLDLDTDQLVEIAKQSPLLLEDIDRKMSDETKLFHLFNSVKQANQSLLLTARTWPQSWSASLPDLLSRLKAATIVEIGEPNEILLTQVLFKLFADRQIEIDGKVVKYLVMRMERSLATAQQAVNLMDQMALSKKIAVNRTIASDVLTILENRKSD